MPKGAMGTVSKQGEVSATEATVEDSSMAEKEHHRSDRGGAGAGDEFNRTA